ncbi:alcohol oxidase [Westerdykella ornata]|uniref:Alcohol oxidase n=1 Tax=Westerdykella ornata TaxID=318751 RepID=A0A6A6JWI2_WESOR|nr:alcohol oxidase [Westerdykella ornata]KAF2280962.1 alcohol oxidase [Westerdykella ornata]
MLVLRCSMVHLLSAVCLGICSVNAASILASSASVKRSVHELRTSYDYVIIGGGTSGLVVANRLTEDPSVNVLVVEYGYFGDDPCIWMPTSPVARITGPSCTRHRFVEPTVPQPGINNASTVYMLGAVVGGSSAINGMVFDRGTKADYDSWEELGNPGWGWDGLFEYFKKSATWTPPSREAVEKYGYTWDEAAYGGGPIQATLSNFQWPNFKFMWDAWDDLNITGPKDHALGQAVGLFWLPASQHSKNQTRSYARYGYYDPVRERPNYHLFIGHKAEKILLSSRSAVEGVVIYDRDKPDEKSVVKAKRETILAAGGAHTPQLLQLSGIGPKAILEAAGIQTRVDLPGVGENFQDHPQAKLICNYTNDFWPNQGTLETNQTFQAEALAQYNTNKTGPLTLSMSNAVVFLPLNGTHSSPESFLAKLAAQEPGAYLPPSLPSTVVAGYAAQKKVLASLYARNDAAIYESPFNGACSRTVILQKPLSRGNIHINGSNPYGPPIIDFRVYSNPLDVEYAIEGVKFTRKLLKTASLAPLQPVELGPGPNVTDTAGLEAHVRATSGPTSFHVSGTAAMLPRELGGVVAPDLRVYGTKGLSVVDASIMPLIPSAHLSATVYAVAEKASDIIKKRAKRS